MKFIFGGEYHHFTLW